MGEDEFFRRAREDLFPKMKGAALSIVIAADPDPKLCMELGAAILLDKPIVVVVPEGQKLPTNLSRIASAIVQGDISQSKGKKQLQEAITRVIKNDKRMKQ